jgi:predicted ATPase/class 3 adenylate cyclase
VSEQPTGTVTFLFTDIEGSTRLWQEHPKEMRAVLARHDELVRSAIEGRGGYVVKTTGDGFHGAFGDARAAVGAAVDGQRALRDEPWRLPDALRVRMGLHSGPAELRDGDYFGASVNRAARITSVAHGGQIVVSAVTYGLAHGDGIQMVDLGEHRLKDLSEAERIFQVVHPGLRQEFPPLRSLEWYATNLPMQGTSFIGRESDVARVTELLKVGRLVTLAGTGGVGKTRLAVHVAADLLSRFPDGVWFCELAGVDDANGMAQVVAAALGCVQRPGLSLSASIVEFSRTRQSLLVLDNCEHLLDDVSLFAEELLYGCEHVRLLATSREALDVGSERVVRVRSLTTPEPPIDTKLLLDFSAVRLFVDRVSDAGAEAEWDARQWTAVAEICRRVDGIPLAIELAAARCVALNPVDVAARLDERFRLLTGKSRSRIERHQTLRATVEWSYQLLDPEERAVFDAVGVFAGGFDAPAAISVASDENLDEWSITDALANLVSKSMLATDGGPDGATRYFMLETLRQYARERLEDCGASEVAWGRHAAYFAQWAHDAERGFVSADDVLWLARIRAELDNIRTAVGWALDRRDSSDQQLGLVILAALGEAGDQDIALGLNALSRLAVPLAEHAQPELRSPILTSAAYGYWQWGDVDEARRLVELALVDGPIPGRVNPLAPHNGLVAFEMSSGNWQRALDFAAQARELFDSIGSDYEEARLRGAFATFEAMIGNDEQARADADRSLALARRLGNQGVLTTALAGRAWALNRLDPSAALAAVEQCLALHRRHGFSRGVSEGVAALAAHLYARTGDLPRAIDMLREALTMARDDGALPQVVANLTFALPILRRIGNPQAAAILIGGLEHGALKGLGRFPGTEDARHYNLARLHQQLGQHEADALVERGTTMPYDDLLDYAIAQLAQDDA